MDLFLFLIVACFSSCLAVIYIGTGPGSREIFVLERGGVLEDLEDVKGLLPSGTSLSQLNFKDATPEELEAFPLTFFRTSATSEQLEQVDAVLRRCQGTAGQAEGILRATITQVLGSPREAQSDAVLRHTDKSADASGEDGTISGGNEEENLPFVIDITLPSIPESDEYPARKPDENSAQQFDAKPEQPPDAETEQLSKKFCTKLRLAKTLPGTFKTPSTSDQKGPESHAAHKRRSSASLPIPGRGCASGEHSMKHVSGEDDSRPASLPSRSRQKSPRVVVTGANNDADTN